MRSTSNYFNDNLFKGDIMDWMSCAHWIDKIQFFREVIKSIPIPEIKTIANKCIRHKRTSHRRDYDAQGNPYDMQPSPNSLITGTMKILSTLVLKVKFKMKLMTKRKMVSQSHLRPCPS